MKKVNLEAAAKRMHYILKDVATDQEAIARETGVRLIGEKIEQKKPRKHLRRPKRESW